MDNHVVSCHADSASHSFIGIGQNQREEPALRHLSTRIINLGAQCGRRPRGRMPPSYVLTLSDLINQTHFWSRGRLSAGIKCDDYVTRFRWSSLVTIAADIRSHLGYFCYLVSCDSINPKAAFITAIVFPRKVGCFRRFLFGNLLRFGRQTYLGGRRRCGRCALFNSSSTTFHPGDAGWPAFDTGFSRHRRNRAAQDIAKH